MTMAITKSSKSLNKQLPGQSATIVAQETELSNLRRECDSLRTELDSRPPARPSPAPAPRDSGDSDRDPDGASKRPSPAPAPRDAGDSDRDPDGASERCAALCRENGALRERVEGLLEEAKAAKARIAGLEGELDAGFDVDEIADLVSRMEAMESERETLKRENESIPELQGRVRDLQAALQQLREGGASPDRGSATVRGLEAEIARMSAEKEALVREIRRAVAFQRKQASAIDRFVHVVERCQNDIVGKIEGIVLRIPRQFERIERRESGRTRSPRSPHGTPLRRSPQRSGQMELHPRVSSLLASLEQTVQGHRKQLHDDHVEFVGALSEASGHDS
jgi:DNA repair exonuclease SbcCD ATPase subunit